MKLVELLARDLSEWPEDFVAITQDDGCAIYGWISEGAEFRDGGWYSPEDDDCGMNDLDISDPEQASDYRKSIVTKEQWQAERDRQKGGEWKRHRGGKCPVDGKALVEYRLRNGYTDTWTASSLDWSHTKVEWDVMSYRVISQPQAEEEEVVPVHMMLGYGSKEEMVSQIGEVSPFEQVANELKWDQIDGPIKWRDTVNELNAYIEEFTREREALINRLALEGFALLPAMTPVMGVADELPTFRDWMVGDIVEVISTENFAGAGLRVGDQMPIVDTDSRDGTVKVVSGSWGGEDNYKFIRRP